MTEPGLKEKPIDEGTPSHQILSILLISVMGLFLEMLMIRWICTEVRLFAYLQNSILVVCFLGLGLGCLTCRQPIVLRQTLIPLAFLALIFSIPVSRSGLAKVSELFSVLGGFVIWHSAITRSLWQTLSFVALGLATTYFMLALLVDVFVPLGRILGRLIDDHPNTLWAYSVNVVGSLLGTWLFVFLAFAYQPPFIWFAILGILFLFFVYRRGRAARVNLALLLGLVAVSGLASWVPGSLEAIWSPYQKLVLRRSASANEVGDYIVTVNTTGYQAMIDLSQARTQSDPERFTPALNGLSQYDIPLLLHPKPQSYLVVGAGSGNDVAAGLRHGVSTITAVEIDPAIIALGRRYHPEAPYSSPAVRLVNDDARSYFASSQEKFDVISFGLLDSHTTTAMTNARLDHYVYTEESIRRAKSLLADGGVMVLSFEAQKPYIADRMAGVLRKVFNDDPIVFRIPTSPYGWGGVMFITGDLAAARQQIDQNPRLAAYIRELQKAFPINLTYTTKIVTDDWPYIYLEKPSIPILFFLLAGLFVLILVRSYRRWGASGVIARWGTSHWHFFFLGAAFLLLEVQNISKASVVLGNTWQVNAVIVSGVLAMILLANLVVHRFPRVPLPYVYVSLLGVCLALYFVDLAQFAFLPYAVKALVVGVLTALPMLFSGIIFARSFTLVTGKDEALGANLIGALVGGLLQSITFVTGIKALLLIVAGLYFLAVLTRPRLVEQRVEAVVPSEKLSPA